MTDNVPPHTGVIDKGGLTNDPRPAMNGRGDVGSVIHVLVDGREVGTAVVKPNGTWSFSLPRALSDGEYRLTVRASNDAGRSVPSTSYGILVDTTPPSQPKIEAVSEGTSPMLSGRAEAYSTVAVYDGATLLGMTTTKMDGTWTFQLPSGMSHGTHALTVSAMDPAGNTSVRSEGFDVTVGPVAPPVPTTKAVLDEMGRDSGSFNFDRLTNDGTAGRLLSGHLSAALAAGEKVQVSTDGGRTWVDAIMKTDGTWVAIDSNAHAGNWTIQTRVVNAAGAAGEVHSTEVVLKTFVPPPTSVDMADGVIVVKFAAAQVEAGTKLSVMIGKEIFLHTLTAQEIASGTVRFAPANGISGMPAVAIIDMAGNTSQYRQSSMVEFSENFDAYTSVSLFKGQSISLQYFTLTGTEDRGRVTWNQGLYSGHDFRIIQSHGLSDPPSTTALGITGTVRLDMKDGLSATRFSFDVGDVTGSEQLTVIFRDGAGNVIYTSAAIKSSGGLRQHFDFSMPNGQSFVSIEFMQNPNSPINTLIWVDNFVFSGKSSGQLFDAPTFHELAGETAYYGGNGDTVFAVENVSYFSYDGSGAHGGAGIDTLKLTGANQYLDMTALNSGVTEKITGIEIIDITGTGNNTLKLSIKDVLNLGHENLFRSDGHTQLMVKGDAGDRVDLAGMPGLEGGGWRNIGLAAVDGFAFTVYENELLNVEVMVQFAVTARLV
ncbi:Ig-like domain-containing protein [Burkholderia pyrrocinia]|uniref:Ig-like domain-containing protein n=1 Tax=Burkholderia pyrrocinia TaxID=60550 RepID=UPI00215AF185|nr:Ig-like domain-containing protein [Burkholderia pyrrocinia]UVE64001.1 Ig-like domain-containing protein [Burkholderia pyrrocinia]